MCKCGNSDAPAELGDHCGDNVVTKTCKIEGVVDAKCQCGDSEIFAEQGDHCQTSEVTRSCKSSDSKCTQIGETTDCLVAEDCYCDKEMLAVISTVGDIC